MNTRTVVLPDDNSFDVVVHDEVDIKATDKFFGQAMLDKAVKYYIHGSSKRDWTLEGALSELAGVRNYVAALEATVASLTHSQ